MYMKICSVCKNKFYSENKHFERGCVSHNYCKLKKKCRAKKEQRFFRTSTPVSDIESSPTSSFTDSVTDFFYQSWKSGLYSNVTKSHQKPLKQWNQQYYTMLQPIYYTPQFIYVYVQYIQQIGYRSDGTFGVLPAQSYWIWNFS